MPAGFKLPRGFSWLKGEKPAFSFVPPGEYWRLHKSPYGPTAANPRSEARLALVGTHDMLYAGDSLACALWETLLRNAEFGKGRKVIFDLDVLKGWSATKIALQRNDVLLLELGNPGLRALFPNNDSVEAVAVSHLLTTPKHKQTHQAAKRLRKELRAVGVSEMPALSWPSRQISTETVYLFYAPPMVEDWWVQASTPQALDTQLGYALIEAEFAARGFSLDPISFGAKVPDDADH